MTRAPKNPPNMARRMGSMIPKSLLNWMSFSWFSVQLFVQDHIIASSRMHYVVIFLLYGFFLLFGIGVQGLLGFDLWHYLRIWERLLNAVYSILHGDSFVARSSATPPSSGSSLYGALVELMCVLLSVASLVAFFGTGFRRYEVPESHLPPTNCFASHSTNSQAQTHKQDKNPQKQTPKTPQHNTNSLTQNLKHILASFFTNNSAPSPAATFVPCPSNPRAKELYLWRYHPFLKNMFIFFNPFQLILFMLLKRSDSFLTKFTLLIITVSLTIIFYVLVHLFEQKSRAEQRIAAQVMQVQQDFHTRWHEARRIAERQVIQDLIDEGELPEESRLSAVSRTVQRNQDRLHMHHSPTRSTTSAELEPRARSGSHASAPTRRFYSMQDELSSSEDDELRVIPPSSVSSRVDRRVTAPSTRPSRRPAAPSSKNPFQNKRGRKTR